MTRVRPGAGAGTAAAVCQSVPRLEEAPGQAESLAINQLQPTPAGRPRACAGETEKPQNKLLEAQNGERLDFGAPGAAVGANPQLATVGGGDGAEVRRGVAGVAERYKGGTRAMLRELARLLREQCEALKRIG